MSKILNDLSKSKDTEHYEADVRYVRLVLNESKSHVIDHITFHSEWIDWNCIAFNVEDLPL